jgi:3-isopropylmalate/(R)-2-methylmalate dehydratase large subunit
LPWKQIKEEGLDIPTNLDLYCANPVVPGLAMNDDKVPPGKYAVSLPIEILKDVKVPEPYLLVQIMAAAAATGVLTDPRDLL